MRISLMEPDPYSPHLKRRDIPAALRELSVQMQICNEDLSSWNHLNRLIAWGTLEQGLRQIRRLRRRLPPQAPKRARIVTR